MYRPRGASITILTLLAVSSGFQFDLPKAREASREQTVTQQRDRPATSPRSTPVTAPREIKGPRTHPDWVRTSALSTNASRTRNLGGNAGRISRNPGYRDGEIPL
jgi:hypothetical protein